MAKATAAKGTATKRGAKAAATPDEAAPSLAEIGRAAMHKAQRAALLAELRRQKWSLVATGAALAMGGSANVVRAIHKLGLDAEHRAARIRKITAG